MKARFCSGLTFLKLLICLLISFGIVLSITLACAEQTKLSANDGEDLDQFGASVAIDGKTAIVGAKGDNSAYVFIHSDSTWVFQQKLAASDDGHGWFGTSVSVDGDTAIVGAETKDNFGAAYIFSRSGTSWTQDIKLEGNSYYSYSYFGRSVDIDGDTVIVGAEGYASDVTDVLRNGAVFIYVRTGTSWELQQLLTTNDTTLASFGRGVALDGNTAVVYANGERAIYIYTRSGTNWVLQQKLTSDDCIEEDLLTGEPAFDGDTLVVRAANENYSNRKSVYVYQRTNSVWAFQQKLKPNDGTGRESSPRDLAIDGDTIIIGENGYKNTTGTAIIFKRSGTIWTQQTKLTASDGEVSDNLGSSVAIDGENFLIGAHCDDSCKGSAYIFTLDPFSRPNFSWPIFMPVIMRSEY